MSVIIWKIKYAFEIRRLLKVSLLTGYDMAGATVECYASDIADGNLTPKQASEEERDEWLQSL